MKEKKVLCVIASSLVVIGALNWGLVGLFDFNLVTALFGNFPKIEKAIYILVGLSGLSGLFAMCCCKKGSCDTASK